MAYLGDRYTDLVELGNTTTFDLGKSERTANIVIEIYLRIKITRITKLFALVNFIRWSN